MVTRILILTFKFPTVVNRAVKPRPNLKMIPLFAVQRRSRTNRRGWPHLTVLL